MKKELTEKLFNDFPTLYRGRKLPLTENLMGFGFECGNGWFNLIYELSEKLSKQDPSCMAVQVKEKFGGLRFYTNGISESGYNLIYEYEDKSYSTCENCGNTKTAKKRAGSWIRTLCNTCHIKFKIKKFIRKYIWI